MICPFETMDLKLTVEDVIKGQGADPEVIAFRKPALIEVANQALQLGSSLIAPAVFSIVVSRQEILRYPTLPTEMIQLNLDAIDKHVDDALSYAVLVCTIGSGLEEFSSRMMAEDAALALALDGMANAAIDRLAERVFRDTVDEAEAEGLGASLPISPGSTSWPLETGQPFIFGLVKPDPALVRLSESFLMLPRKSASFIIGVGPQVTRHGQTCDQCSMAETCRYRIRKPL